MQLLIDGQNKALKFNINVHDELTEQIMLTGTSIVSELYLYQDCASSYLDSTGTVYFSTTPIGQTACRPLLNVRLHLAITLIMISLFRIRQVHTGTIRIIRSSIAMAFEDRSSSTTRMIR